MNNEQPMGVGAEQWRTTLERALRTARERNIEARNLISVLRQHASDDHLRERIRAWLDGDRAPSLTANLRPHQRAALGASGREHGERCMGQLEHRDFRATDCSCDYCHAFAQAAPEASPPTSEDD